MNAFQRLKFLATTNPLSDIPNQQGFLLTAVFKDGSHHPCSVVRDARGFHSLSNGIALSDCVGWLPRPTRSEQLRELAEAGVFSGQKNS